MKTLVVVFVICVINKLASAENCDKLGILVYEDMGCKATQADTNSCPTKYDCEGLQKTNKCFFRGQSYNAGDPIGDRSPACQWGCFCNIRGNETKFNCPQFGCQDWGRSPEPGCYWTYNLDKCCASGSKCPKPDEKIAKCVVDGVEYREGESFNPKDSCHHCVCKEGFSGKIEAPYCKRSECGVQISNQVKTQRKCAPMYYKQSRRNSEALCCPNGWLCPDGTENLRPVKPEVPSDKICHFGEETVEINNGFEKNMTQYHFTRKIKCECKVPPLLTCIEI